MSNKSQINKNRRTKITMKISKKMNKKNMKISRLKIKENTSTINHQNWLRWYIQWFSLQYCVVCSTLLKHLIKTLKLRAHFNLKKVISENYLFQINNLSQSQSLYIKTNLFQTIPKITQIRLCKNAIKNAIERKIAISSSISTQVAAKETNASSMVTETCIMWWKVKIMIYMFHLFI